jgi:hypothetical protein
MHVWMMVCMCVCMYVYMYVCMYVRVELYNSHNALLVYRHSRTHRMQSVTRHCFKLKTKKKSLALFAKKWPLTMSDRNSFRARYYLISVTQYLKEVTRQQSYKIIDGADWETSTAQQSPQGRKLQCNCWGILRSCETKLTIKKCCSIPAVYLCCTNTPP